MWVHLTSRRKAHFKGLFVLMLISALAEMVSIGVIFPFLGVITNPEAVFTHHLMQPVNSFFKVNSAVDLRLIVTSLFIAIVVAVAHKQFKEYTDKDYQYLYNGETVVIDVKNIVDRPTWKL